MKLLRVSLRAKPIPAERPPATRLNELVGICNVRTIITMKVNQAMTLMMLLPNERLISLFRMVLRWFLFKKIA